MRFQEAQGGVMSNVAYSEKYTVDDYKLWQGDWELIYGDAYAMTPSPTFNHQYVSGKIFRQIDEKLDEKIDECSACSAIMEMDWDVSEDTVVRPDVMVICYEPDQRLGKRPEIVVEVISPASAGRDELLKFELYRKEGVPYYILVYPDIKKAKIYQLIDYEYRKTGDFSNESFCFHIEQCTIEFDFGLIWRR